MTDRPIIFSAPMVRALLAGQKTQTRRVAWRDAGFGLQDFASEQLEDMDLRGWDVVGEGDEGLFRVYKPTPWQKVKLGDRLWVRESVHVDDDQYSYMADHSGDPKGLGWRPSIHMPRTASRLTLVVTGVKIERLHDISETDAFAEGVETDAWDMAPVAKRYGTDDGWFVGWSMGVQEPSISVDAGEVCRKSFASLWNSINGPTAWDENPFVVAVSFEVVSANISAMPVTIDLSPELSATEGNTHG